MQIMFKQASYRVYPCELSSYEAWRLVIMMIKQFTPSRAVPRSVATRLHVWFIIYIQDKNSKYIIEKTTQ